jgi:hypothetical protein
VNIKTLQISEDPCREKRCLDEFVTIQEEELIYKPFGSLALWSNKIII